MTDKTDSKRIYRQPLNYENGVLLPKIREISTYRDTDIKLYESAVYTLILLLPKDLRHEALKFRQGGIKEDLTADGKKDYDDVLVYILELLENNNICFPKITYTIGHD